MQFNIYWLIYSEFTHKHGLTPEYPEIANYYCETNIIFILSSHFFPLILALHGNNAVIHSSRSVVYSPLTGTDFLYLLQHDASQYGASTQQQ